LSFAGGPAGHAWAGHFRLSIGIELSRDYTSTFACSYEFAFQAFTFVRSVVYCTPNEVSFEGELSKSKLLARCRRIAKALPMLDFSFAE